MNEKNVPSSIPDTLLGCCRVFRSLYGVPFPRFTVMVTSNYEDAHMEWDPKYVAHVDIIDCPHPAEALFTPEDYPWECLCKY